LVRGIDTSQTFIAPAGLIEEICARISRNLTVDEWVELIGDKPYKPTCENHT
jgi:hypothetical protein